MIKNLDSFDAVYIFSLLFSYIIFNRINASIWLSLFDWNQNWFLENYKKSIIAIIMIFSQVIDYLTWNCNINVLYDSFIMNMNESHWKSHSLPFSQNASSIECLSF